MTLKIISTLVILSFLAVPQGLAAGGEKAVAGISFAAPETWTETEPVSTMRTFQFEVPGSAPNLKADLAVFYFGQGAGGDVQSNILRWKSQFTKLAGEQTEERNVNSNSLTIFSP